MPVATRYVAFDECAARCGETAVLDVLPWSNAGPGSYNAWFRSIKGLSRHNRAQGDATPNSHLFDIAAPPSPSHPRTRAIHCHLERIH